MNIHQEIKAYLDGELNEHDAEVVRAAIAADPQLQQEVTSMKLITHSLKTSAPGESGAPGLHETMAKVRGKGRNRTWVRWASIAGAGVLVWMLAFPVFQQGKFASTDMSESAANREGAGVMKRSVPSDAEVTSSVPAEESPRFKAKDSGRDVSLERPRVASPGRSEQSTASPAVRDVVRNGELQVAVLDVHKSVTEVSDQTRAMGGFVQTTNESTADGGKAMAAMVLRVPTGKFDATMAMARNLGNVVSSSITGVDVTQERINAEESAKELRKQELYYMEMLRGARRESAANEIRWKIREIRGQIAEQDQTARNIRKEAAFSTVNLTLEERPKVAAGDKGWAEDALGSALQSLSALGRVLATVGIYVLVLAPLWIPAVLIVRWLGRRA